MSEAEEHGLSPSQGYSVVRARGRGAEVLRLGGGAAPLRERVRQRLRFSSSHAPCGRIAGSCWRAEDEA